MRAGWHFIAVLAAVAIVFFLPYCQPRRANINSLAIDVPMSETYRGMLPFLAADVVRVAMLVTFAALSLWLARLIA